MTTNIGTSRGLGNLGRKVRGFGVGPDVSEMQHIQTDAWQEGGNE